MATASTPIWQAARSGDELDGRGSENGVDQGEGKESPSRLEAR